MFQGRKQKEAVRCGRVRSAPCYFTPYTPAPYSGALQWPAGWVASHLRPPRATRCNSPKRSGRRPRWSCFGQRRVPAAPSPRGCLGVARSIRPAEVADRPGPTSIARKPRRSGPGRSSRRSNEPIDGTALMTRSGKRVGASTAEILPLATTHPSLRRESRNRRSEIVTRG
jgi:hypothetical protein